ncbi:MAG TPA: ATP-dependent DNA ligase [Candidatus Eisenbacteria bacterium]|nr:ATP-dependent DNA ligase [Candidatus Eisenbacteria bacterium]
MRIAELATTSRELAATSRRNEKIERLAVLLRRLAPEEIAPAVALLSGAPRQRRIGIGPSIVRAAASEAHAEEPTLTIAEVDRELERLAGLQGAGSTTARRTALGELMRRATAGEADWLARVLIGEVRQGALESVLLDAIARAAGIAAAEVRRAAMLSGDLGAVAHAALTDGRAGLEGFHLEMFRPVLPMLASPADTLDEAMESLGTAALEYKLDGARVQVHKQGDEVRVFSRLLNDVTVAVPELVESVRALPARELILDGEVIALKPDGTPHPFQVTMRRFGRRLEVEALRRELPLTPYYFDILRCDDQDLIDAPLSDRAAALAEAAREALVPRRLVASVAEAEAFFDEALERGHEGIMAKAPASAYAAGSRGIGWFKVKPAHTLDLVVLAVEPGSGRRSGWLSNIHLGARDAGGGFATIGKTFKGMTDAMLEWQTRRFRELAVGTDGYVVHLRPEQVVEVAFNDVQESTQYASGVALRFARVKRYRDDKPAGNADTLETVYAILRGQVGKQRAKPS